MAAESHDGHFVMIPLTKGKFAIVDEADAEMLLSGATWAAVRNQDSCTWYATRHEGATRELVSMHALIAGYKGVDHANRNGLDNRRVNLRPATRSQNAANRAPQRSNTSGYKGVDWHPLARKWRARIVVNGRGTYLGLYGDPVEAARVYNRAAAEAFGEYAWLNPV